jgi:hypothetical protein
MGGSSRASSRASGTPPTWPSPRLHGAAIDKTLGRGAWALATLQPGQKVVFQLLARLVGDEAHPDVGCGVGVMRWLVRACGDRRPVRLMDQGVGQTLVRTYVRRVDAWMHQPPQPQTPPAHTQRHPTTLLAISPYMYPGVGLSSNDVALASMELSIRRTAEGWSMRQGRLGWSIDQRACGSDRDQSPMAAPPCRCRCCRLPRIGLPACGMWGMVCD